MAALALLVALPARAQQVVSANTVGYTKLTLQPGLNMIGNQFLGVGTTGFQNINKMFVESSQITPGYDDGEADSILRWTGNGYGEIYYYDEFDSAWESVDEPGVVASTTVNPGEGVWYKCLSDEPITTMLAGEVPTNLTYTVEIQTGLNFVANPFPSAICPNSENFTVEGVVAGMDDGEADSILKWTGSGYGEIYYFDDMDTAWESVDEPGVVINSNIIDPAKGFWYKHQGSGAVLTFKRPYAIP